MKSALKVLNFTVTALLLVVIVGVSLLALSARRSPDKIPTVSGRKILNVLSGSMEPAIHTGDVIIVRPIAPNEELKEGDVITFKAKGANGGATDMLITHRIVGIVSVNGKPSAYMTKGDANDSDDLSPVARDQVVGVYTGRIPYFGYVSNFLRTPVGIVLLLVIPGVILIAGEIRKIYLIMLEEEAKEKAAKAQLQGGEQSPR